MPDKKQTEATQKKRHIAIRNMVVLFIVVLVGIGLLIAFRAEYLNIKEIGEQYTDLFFKNVNNKLGLSGGIFIVTYVVIYGSNKLIDK